MAVVTDRLTKYYKRTVGCRDVSIEVDSGEIFGFLGPNGAGKSTVVKMLNGLVIPTSGSAEILGMPVGSIELRRHIGYLPENFKYHDWMTGEQLLTFHASLYKMDKHSEKKRIRQLLALVKLVSAAKRKISTYSKGMQQRLGIASALLSDPAVVFFDEPTSALDPVGRKDMRDIIADLKQQGKTVFLNSHLLSEMEMVCDSIAVINKGSIIKKGRMSDILDKYITVEIKAECLNGKILDLLKAEFGKAFYTEDKLKVNVNSKSDIHNIARIIIDNGGKLFGLHSVNMSLEEMFLDILNNGGQN